MFSDGSGTGFDGDADVIPLGIDNCLRFLMIKSLRFLWQESHMVLMLVFFVCCWFVRHRFGWDKYVIKLGIDGLIELEFSDQYFKGCHDGNIAGIAEGVGDGINTDVGRCLSGGLGTGFDVDADILTLGHDEIVEIYFLISSLNLVNSL